MQGSEGIFVLSLHSLFLFCLVSFQPLGLAALLPLLITVSVAIQQIKFKVFFTLLIHSYQV